MPSLTTLAGVKAFFNVKARPSTLLLILAIFTLTAIVLLTVKSILDDKKLTLDTESKHALFAVRLLEEHARQQLILTSLRFDEISNAI